MVLKGAALTFITTILGFGVHGWKLKTEEMKKSATVVSGIVVEREVKSVEREYVLECTMVNDQASCTPIVRAPYKKYFVTIVGPDEDGVTRRVVVNVSQRDYANTHWGKNYDRNYQPPMGSVL